MKRSMICVAVLCFLLLGTQAALAAGFEVAEVSGRQMGNAFAGKAASAEDASTVFFNPAAMMRFDSFNLVGALAILATDGEWKNKGSTGSPALGSQRLSGGDGGNPGGISVIPSLYFIAPLSDHWAIGFGVNSPFGLKTEYHETWQGRYHAVTSDLQVIDFMATVAYRLHQNLSLGVGIDYQLAQAELSNMVDYGSVFGQAGLMPEAHDGLATLDSDISGAVGFSASALFELTPQTRFGLTFRSEVEHELEGDATFRKDPTVAAIIAQMPAGSRAFTDTTGYADITLPAQVYFSAYHEFNEQWALLFDVTWTGWSSFEELRIVFDNAAQPDSVQPENWNDVWRFSVGTTYRPTPQLALRFGVAYDQSPIDDPYRTPRIPTGDRIWLAFGVGYAINADMVLDFSYMHVFIDDGKVHQTVATGQTLAGDFVKSNANVLALQLTLSF